MRTALDLVVVFLFDRVTTVAAWFVGESADAGRRAGLLMLALVGLVYVVGLGWSWLKNRPETRLRS